jgi:c-di-GMP-binding flagellar brake protein YcgR
MVDKLLTEHLHAICRAVLAALEESVPGEVLACDLVQVDHREFRFQSVAAAHFPGGPVRRLLLGCEARLAGHFAETLASGDAGPGSLQQGLAVFCQKVQFSLGGSGLPWAGDQDFLVHDSDQFRVVCDGARNFLFRVAVAEGRLDLVIDLAPRLLSCTWLTDALSAGQTQVGLGEESINDPEVVRRIMAHLAASGADVEVKMPGEGDRLELLQATFLARCFQPDGERLSLTCARRTSLEEAADIPDKVEIVFILQDKLLQATCPVLAHDLVWLDEDVSLPALELGYPGSVTYGQRRGAFRLEPPERVTGTVQRQQESGQAMPLVASRIPMRVVDCSFTGMKILLGGNAIVSGFKGGARVEVVFELPDRFGEVTLPAIVRRVHINPEEPGTRGTTLGLEFASDEESPSLTTLRRYIQDRHHARLASGSAELEIG